MSVQALPDVVADPALVELVEHLLEMVRAGEVVALAMAAEHVGRRIGTATSGDMDVYRMLGALESLKLRIVRERDA
ncbi:MAG TPA: hypothetical protein VFG69_01645 [Nannocystaceae bacterium]|nr:hypothetical protein [Nannocystaceae bacterium]